MDKIGLEGKKVLLRVDFNVPIENGRIKDDTRIRKSLKTIKYLLDKNCAVIIMSHLGRPQKDLGDEQQIKRGKYSLRPVAQRLSSLVDCIVTFCQDFGTMAAVQMSDELGPGRNTPSRKYTL